jgi:hypothetical protein
VNSSVISELVYWLIHEDPNHERTLVLFEESVYEQLGSLIPGLVGVRDVHFEKIPDKNLECAATIAQQRCMNWTMNELRDTLKKRYLDQM